MELLIGAHVHDDFLETDARHQINDLPLLNPIETLIVGIDNLYGGLNGEKEIFATLNLIRIALALNIEVVVIHLPVKNGCAIFLYIL
jgi:hypothetical protein